jgi:hypothetical protein
MLTKLLNAWEKPSLRREGQPQPAPGLAEQGLKRASCHSAGMWALALP